LTEELDTEFLYKDLVHKYERARSNPTQNHIRQLIRKRQQQHDAWLISHGYQCGQDYQPTANGYRFATGALVTAFVLGNSQ
jgi:DNA-binding transcriptional regulator YbjK